MLQRKFLDIQQNTSVAVLPSCIPLDLHPYLDSRHVYLNAALDATTSATTCPRIHGECPARSHCGRYVGSTASKSISLRVFSENPSPSKTEPDVQSMVVDNMDPEGTNQPGSRPEAAIEVVDIEDDSKQTVVPPPSTPQTTVTQPTVANDTIDICFEASKLPLDVAIFNSARAAGGDEKIRKYLQAVLVIGGSALIPGMAHALESRWEWVLSSQLLSHFLFRMKAPSHCHTTCTKHGKSSDTSSSQRSRPKGSSLERRRCAFEDG